MKVTDVRIDFVELIVRNVEVSQLR